MKITDQMLELEEMADFKQSGGHMIPARRRILSVQVKKEAVFAVFMEFRAPQPLSKARAQVSE